MRGNSLAVQRFSRLPLQGAWVLSLVRELRSHMPHVVAKKKKKKEKWLQPSLSGLKCRLYNLLVFGIIST